MILHALVDDLRVARVAIEGGSTLVQLRVKNVSTTQLVEYGLPFRDLCARARVTFVVNDDVEAALAVNADGVHLGRGDPGKELARAAGLMLGISATSVYEAIAGVEQGAAYIGAGPVWATPSKPDAGAPLGLDGLAAICEAVNVPVVAIGGIDASNARDCINAGAEGVAVVRASADARGLRAALDASAL